MAARSAASPAGDNSAAAFVLASLERDKALQLLQSRLEGRSVALERPVRARRIRKKPRAALPRRPPKAELAAVSVAQMERQHALWAEYAEAAVPARAGADRLARALAALDWHGGWVRVARSPCPSHVAASGYVLSETRRTLVLLSAAGKRARIPKAGAVFELTLRGAPLEVTRECG